MGTEVMATISGRVLSVLKDACGVHEFNDEEMAGIKAVADQLEAILKSSKDRQQREMTARFQLKQMGSWS
jgi:hypothetical protein